MNFYIRRIYRLILEGEAVAYCYEPYHNEYSILLRDSAANYYSQILKSALSKDEWYERQSKDRI